MEKSFGEERVDHDGRRAGHQRADQIERADAALDQPPRPPPRAGHRDDRRVGADDERREQQERAEGGHLADCPAFFAASYFEGHFAMMPFGSTCEARPGVSCPFSTTSASSPGRSLNVSGTMPL